MQEDQTKKRPQQTASDWDHSSHEAFYDYYSRESQEEKTLQRFRSIRDCALRIAARDRSKGGPLDVADVGCGAGTQSIMWAELGHRVHGLDINEPLLKLAEKRAAEAGYPIDFQLGTAVKLPWADGTMDVCLVLELLEHVADWKSCINEFARVLRPGGIMVLSTTNKLCPIQQEFNLPLYSWYPAVLKHYFERLAVTSRPQLANYAKYPAVNWFTFYSLRRVLAERGFESLDRFDVMDLSNKGALAKGIVGAVRKMPPLRRLAHVATSGTVVVAVKSPAQVGRK